MAIVCNMQSGRLYHYTSLAGFVGILESRSLWASGIRYLNDGAEFTYAVDLFAEVLSEAISYRPDLRPVFEMTIHCLLHYDDEAGTGTSNVFVVSFSEHGDTLSQWRAYCQTGAGVSIAIDIPDLEILAPAQGFHFDRCIYDTTEQRSMIAQLVEGFMPSAEQAAQASEDAQFEAANEYLSLFELIAPLLKHPSFAEEREWRVVARRPTAHSLQFRAVRTLLVPYVKFSLQTESGRLPISYVVVGPTPHPHLNRSAVQAALGAAGLRTVGTECSVIPFRAW